MKKELSEDRDDQPPDIRFESKAATSTLLLMIGLFTLKLVIGIYYGSLAVMADAFNSLSDILMIIAMWMTIRIITRRPNGKFPYGYYRLGDLVAVLLAILFVVISVVFVWIGLKVVASGYIGCSNYIIVAIVEAMCALTVLAYSIMLRRMFRCLNIGTFTISAGDLYLDTLLSVFVAINVFLNGIYDYSFEGYATIIVAGFIALTAVRVMKDSLKNLLDRWDKPELINKIREIVEKYPPLEAGQIRLRRGGPYIIGDATIYAPEEMRLEEIDDIISMIEQDIRKAIPRLQDIVLEVEPKPEPCIICAIPIREGEGMDAVLANSLEDASKYIIVSVDPKNENNTKLIAEFEKSVQGNGNPEVKICKDLAKYNVDCVIVKNVGEVSFELLKAYSIDTYPTDKSVVREAVRDLLRNKLKPINTYEELVGNG